MGTLTVDSIIAKAQILLQDVTGVRWQQSELVGWLNDGQREVVLHRPEASAKTAALSLTTGSTLQTIPSDGVCLIKVTRNMGSSGSSPGRAVRVVSREVMDAQNPNWHTDAAATSVDQVKHYMFDPLNPKAFYVYPRAPLTAWTLEIVYSATPTTAALGGAISVDDVYANALTDYVLFRAYSKDAEYAQNAQLAMAYYTSFANSIGLTIKNQVERNPNQLDGGFNPNVPRKA